jgi:His/Glu/Gln/Arg/opine family amino acid ABC transporter permease subunit
MDFSNIGSNIIKLLNQYWQVFLIDGLSHTLLLTLIAVFFGVALGSLVAICKMSKFWPLRALISVYIEVIRGTPILLQLYIFYFVIPQMLPFLDLSPFMWVAIALCINSSAYVSEVIRSGIQAVDKGQMEAARSLGMSEKQAMIKIILPQAIRNILPALGNEFIMMLKETSLASTFFLGDIMTSYNVVKGATFLTLEPLTIVAIIYLCLTFPLSKIVEKFEKKMASPNSYKARHKKDQKCAQKLGTNP